MSNGFYNEKTGAPRPSIAGRGRRNRMLAIAALAFFCIAVLSGIAALVSFLMRRGTPAFAGDSRPETASIMAEVPMTIDGIDTTGRDRQAVLEQLRIKYPWNMKVVFEDKTYEVENYLEPVLEETVDRAYSEKNSSAAGEGGSLDYNLDIPDFSSHAASIASELHDEWSTLSANSVIMTYDSESDSFIVEEGEKGIEIDEERLRDNLVSAFQSLAFNVTVDAFAKEEVTAFDPEAFRTISTYTTHTSNNANRNTNVKNACVSLNGLVLGPGEKFSFNEYIGPRTPEKGYEKAVAYSGGETVQSYGGGVCQVSSTLYCAVVEAGLQPDTRVGHTFEPTYITPGMDATVSYPNPDFAFTNISPYPVGIKSSYASNTVHLEIFGVPVLEDGVKCYMECEKTREDPAPVTYVEDITLPFGGQAVSSKGKPGTVWVTYLVTEKDGEVISKDYLHTSKYKGKNSVIRRNTTFIMPAVPVMPVPSVPDAAALQGL